MSRWVMRLPRPTPHPISAQPDQLPYHGRYVARQLARLVILLPAHPVVWALTNARQVTCLGFHQHYTFYPLWARVVMRQIAGEKQGVSQDQEGRAWTSAE